MGVKNLWDMLESCKKTLPLHHLQNKRVCIDLSCWMVPLQNVSESHSCMKEKVYLRGLFHRLRALIAVNCTVFFVTDGSIPAIYIKLSTYRRRLNSGSEVSQDDRNLQNVISLRRNMGSEFSCIIKEAKVLGMTLAIACLDGREASEMELMDVCSEVLADNTNPLTAIPINSPRGEPVRRINKMLLEIEKSLSLGIAATKLRKSGAEEEEEEVRNNEKERGKEKE